MNKYVIVEGTGSSAMLPARHLDEFLQSDPDGPSSKVVKEFEAECWCAARHVYARHQGTEAYDMHFCHEDAKLGLPNLCPYYDEIKKTS